MNTPFRAWINAPSKFDPLHRLHGVNVLAQLEYNDIYRVYFLSGSVISQQVLGRYLSRRLDSDKWHS